MLEKPKAKKSIRKLVTLPLDLAGRVEKFRETSGATSESDALKALIEDGLKMRDKPEDLFQRCETSSASGQSIGDIINLVTSDHPLVERTILDDHSLVVVLKSAPDEASERFHYSRAQRKWVWEQLYGNNYDDWRPKQRAQPVPTKRRTGGDLDDDIPF